MGKNCRQCTVGKVIKMLNLLNNRIEVKFARIHKNARLPEFKTDGAAGADLYACNDEIIHAGETKLIHLGLKSEFKPGYVALIYARSGLATKEGLAPANKVGVIDSDYRGEWMVALHNHSKEDRTIDAGERIAQVLFQKIYIPDITEVMERELTDSERGQGGFGSTNKK